MIGIENLEEWVGQEVVDADGEKLGKLDELYYPIDGGEPVLMSIKSGVLGRSRTLVPVKDAWASRSRLRVGHRKEELTDAPAAPAADVSAQDLEAVETFYDVRLAGDRQAGLEATATRVERARAAEEARARADALEQEAADRGATAKDAKQRAKDAAADSDQAQRKHHDALNEADAARAEAAREESRTDPL